MARKKKKSSAVKAAAAHLARWRWSGGKGGKLPASKAARLGYYRRGKR